MKRVRLPVIAVILVTVVAVCGCRQESVDAMARVSNKAWSKATQAVRKAGKELGVDVPESVDEWQKKARSVTSRVDSPRKLLPNQVSSQPGRRKKPDSQE